MQKYVLIALGITAMSGCQMKTTPTERWQEKCASYGYELGSKEMVDCIATEERTHKMFVATIIADDD